MSEELSNAAGRNEPERQRTNARISEELIDITLLTARTILACGGETYRANECCTRILSANGADTVDVIALPTALTLGVRCGDDYITRSASIMDRGTDLSRLDDAIAVSRGLTDGSMTPSQARKRLTAHTAPMPLWKKVPLAAGSATCFSVVFGGGIGDALVTLASALCGMVLYYLLDRLRLPKFISYFVASAVIAGAARLGEIWLGTDVGNVIVSGITPMLPGLAVTNAMRDSINGDIVSTSARMIEAFMVAVSIAAAVGAVLLI